MLCHEPQSPVKSAPCKQPLECSPLVMEVLQLGSRLVVPRLPAVDLHFVQRASRERGMQKTLWFPALMICPARASEIPGSVPPSMVRYRHA